MPDTNGKCCFCSFSIWTLSLNTDKTALGDRSLWCVLTPQPERFSFNPHQFYIWCPRSSESAQICPKSPKLQTPNQRKFRIARVNYKNVYSHLQFAPKHIPHTSDAISLRHDLAQNRYARNSSNSPEIVPRRTPQIRSEPPKIRQNPPNKSK